MRDRDMWLRAWSRQFGRRAPKHISIEFIQNALSYELQLAQIGGFPRHLRQRLKQLSNDAQGALKDYSGDRSSDTLIIKTRAGSDPLQLTKGTCLVRQYHGRTYRVEVTDDGFEFDGTVYLSLSAVTRRITGSHRSGPRFFGLRK